MFSRRAVLKTGVLSAAIPIASRATGATFADKPELDFLIVDTRLRESKRFADALSVNGAAILQTDGDVTDLWYRHLHCQWSSGVHSVAGLTCHDTLFCLERLAWDYRMRLVYRADHLRGNDKKTRHAVHGYSGVGIAGQGLENAGEFWPEYAGLLVGQRARSTATPLVATHVGLRVLSSAVGSATSAYSWILAPIRSGKA